MIAMPSATLRVSGTCGYSAVRGRPSMYSSNCGPGTFVTTRLKKRWRACRRAACDMIVGGAKSARSVSTWAPTAWPDSLRPPIASCTTAKHSTGSSRSTGSGADIAATRLPSAPRSASARTDTGTIAFSRIPSVSTPRPRRKRPSARDTPTSTTSLTVPPNSFLIALKRSRSPSTQVKRRWGPILTFSGLDGAPPPAKAKAPSAERLSRTRPSTWRGPRSTARAPRAISAGTVARSSSASAKSWAPLGAGPGIHGSGWGVGAGTGAVSNSTVVMSTPDTPSTSAW